MQPATKCGCNHSLAVVCALFASLAVAVLLAEDRCLDGGGRVSDAAWTCEMAGGAVASLWSLVAPQTAVLVAAAVGLPVYVAVVAIGRRWLFPYGGHGVG